MVLTVLIIRGLLNAYFGDILKFLIDSCHGIDSTHHTGFTECLLLNHVHEYDSDYSKDIAELLPSSLKDRKIL